MEKETAARLYHKSLLENTMFPEALNNQFTLDQSYDVQFCLLEQRIAAGEKQAGWKVGLTSKAMQQQQGMGEPCLGHLMADGQMNSPVRLEFDQLISPGFENELCLRISKSLSGDVDFETALAAIDGVAPAIEVIEKRGNFAADLPLAIAGNAQQRAFVTGEFVTITSATDLANVEVDVIVNGQSQERALGREVLGNPVNSVIWLAKKLGTYGHSLKAGDLIMSGSFTKQYDIQKDDKICASFSGIGDAVAEFA